MRLFFSIFFFLAVLFSCSMAQVQAAIQNPKLEKDTVEHIVQNLKLINNYASSKAGETFDCHCDKDFKSKAKEVLERIRNEIMNTQGSGVSIGADTHAGPLGINYSFEFLRFGNLLTLFDSEKGTKYAVFCVGGVGGGADVGATLGFSGVKTFGRCDQPSDYAGGFVNIGAQGEFAVGSLGAKLSISFDMSKLASLLEKDFSKNDSRERLRNQFVEFLKYLKQSQTSDDNFILAKIAGALYFPNETSLLSQDEVEGFKTLQEKYGRDFFKKTQEKLSAYVEKHGQDFCRSENVCLHGKASELQMFLNDVGQSLGHCHGFSAGISVGPSAAPLISPYLGYTDYVLMTSVDFNFSSLGPEFANYVSGEVLEFWNSFSESCPESEKVKSSEEERLNSLKKAFFESAKLQINEEAFAKKCKAIIKNSAESTSKTLNYLLN